MVEMFRGKVAWEGTVQAYRLRGHPQAARAYAWSVDSPDGSRRRYVAILQAGPIQTAEEAVRAFLVQATASHELC